MIILAVLLLVGWRVHARGDAYYEDAILGRPLRVGIVSWPGYAGGLVANKGLRPNKDSDFWKHKLLVEFHLVEDEDKLRRQFASGDLDVIWSTVDSLTQQSPEFRRADPRAFMQVDWSRGGDAIIVSSEINRVEDLKGRRVAVSMSASQWLFEYSLENSGLGSDDKQAIRQARVKSQGSNAAAELFTRSAVDAAVLWEPDATRALKARGNNSKILIDTRTAGKLIGDVMVAREGFIQQHPDAIDAFIQGWFEGTTRANAEPALAVQVLQEEPAFAALGEEETQRLLDKAVWATLDTNAETFGLSGGKSLFDELFNWATRHGVENNYISDPLSAEQARDIGRLRERYRATQSPTKPGCGMETPVATIPLVVPFPQGRAEIGDEIRNVLDNQKALLTLQTHTGARFCVQACPDAGECTPQSGTDALGRERELAVIKYLIEQYDRPRSQFVAAGGGGSEAPSAGMDTKYIHLKLIAAGGQR